MTTETAERSLVGTALHLGTPEIADLAREEDFFSPALALIWHAIGAVAKGGVPVTPVSVLLALSKMDEDRYGGSDYVRSLEHEYGGFSFDLATHYATTVKEQARLRRLDESLRTVRDRIAEGATSADVMTELSRLVREPTGGELLRMSAVELSDSERGVSSYFPSIDACNGVGWIRGQTHGVLAPTKGGKTSFLVSSMVLAASDFKRCCYAVFADLNPKQLTKKALRQLCGWSKQPRDLETAAEYQRALEYLRSDAWDVDIYDSSRHGRTVEDFMGKVAPVHARRPYDVLFVDYAQRIRSRDFKGNEQTACLEYVSQELKAFAERLDVPIVLGSQVTATDDEWRTKYADAVREDVGLLLEVDKKKSEVRVRLNRFGPQDIAIPLLWDEELVGFREVENA